MQRAEVVIIGSGPAGYTAAIYAARANLQPTMYEGSMSAGGALMETTDVENFPGFPDGVGGSELMERMRRQALRFGVLLVPDEVHEVDFTDTERLRVVDSSGAPTTARGVILAMGSAHRRLGVVGEDRLAARGVSWCATCDGYFYRDRDVVVVGGGDSALQEALFLTRFATRVTVVHRRDALAASRIMQDRALADPKIGFEWNTVVDEILGNEVVEGVSLRDRNGGSMRILTAQAVFVAIGHEPRSDLVAGQVDLDKQGHVVTEVPGTATSRPGVFACGDLVDGAYRQAVTAAGSGCQAALDLDRHLSSTGYARRTGTGLSSGIAGAGRSQPAANPGFSVVPSAQANGASVPQHRAESLTDDTFAEVIAASVNPVLVDFWAPWCGPCALVHPVMDALATDFAGSLRVAKVNVDECPTTAERYNVTSLPALKLFVGGVPVEHMIGAKTKTTLLAVLGPHLERSSPSSVDLA